MAETQSWILLIFAVTITTGSNNEKWTADVKRHIDASLGADVLIQCRFTYPPEYQTNQLQVFWKKDVSKKKGKGREIENPFIFNPDTTKVMENYRGRTTLVGNVKDGNCSLQIKNMRNNESDLYLRVVVGGMYSFYKYTVSITVTGAKDATAGTNPTGTKRPETVSPVAEINSAPQVMTTSEHATTERLITTTQSSTTKLLLVISVPIAASFIVGIASVAAFVLCRKYGRSRSINRTSSGYYANFSQKPQNQTNSELAQGIREDPRVKVIDDEPVYSNLQALSCQLSAPMEADESIYANV